MRRYGRLVLLVFLWAIGCHPRVPEPELGLDARPLPEHHTAVTADGWQLALFHYPAWFRGSRAAGAERGPAAIPASSAPVQAALPDPQAPAQASLAALPPGAPDRPALRDPQAPAQASLAALPPGGSDRTAPITRLPIILCHGLAANHYTWDLTEERSMARFLADRGYDVWLLDLRGHGDSRRPPKGRRALPDGWGFDEYALYDVPAAIRYVRQVTGAPQVNWIGHSMGGMVIYAYLASSGDPTVRNVVAIGAPGSLDFANDLVSFGVNGIRYVGWAPRIYSRSGARGWARISGRILGGYEETVWHLDNMAPDAARLMFWVGVENIERGVERSFASLQQAGKLVSRDLQTDYQANLSRFSAPLLAIAGKLDGLAPPTTVQRLFDRVGSKDKTYELIGRANGYSVDYGHVDLVMGDHARDDVFPLVHHWLEAHQPGPLTAARAAP